MQDYKYGLNGEGMPKNSFPGHWKGEKGLYCAGLSRRGLLGVSMDAQAIANDINKVINCKK
jgi:indole-3-pyruvate monooxygenase